MRDGRANWRREGAQAIEQLGVLGVLSCLPGKITQVNVASQTEACEMMP